MSELIILNKDIFDGPKYLVPLIELISFKFLNFFLLFQNNCSINLLYEDNFFTSFLVKQL